MDGRRFASAFAALSICSFFYSPYLAFSRSEEQLTKLLDQGKYSELIAEFPAQPVGTEANLVLKVHAQLAMGGFIPLNLIENVRNAQTVFPVKIIGEYFNLTKCPKERLGKKFEGATKCLVLRILNQLPHVDNVLMHENTNLLGALTTFRLLHEKNNLASRQDRVIFSILELSFILSKLRTALVKYAALGENKIKNEQITDIFNDIRSAGTDLGTFSTHYKDVEPLVNHKIFGKKEALLFHTNAQGKAEFLQETGLPLFFKVMDMDNDSTVALIGRNIIVQILDRADNFFRTPST